MNPSVWNSVNLSSRKRPLDTIQEAAPSRNDTLGLSTSAFTSASRSTSQAPASLGKTLRERFAESKWARGSGQLNDISQQSLRYKDGATSQVPASRVEYRGMDSVFAQPPPMSMFETGAPDLNRAPPDHWFSKLRADWLQPKKEELKKKKKKKKIAATDTTESQPSPPQSPSSTQTIPLQPTSAVDTPSALSPTATQYSQDDAQDLSVWEIDTDDGTTLPPSSPMDIDAIGKMVAAFETHTVEDNVPQEMQIAVPDGNLQDPERSRTMIPIIITEVDAEAPSAVETFASSTLTDFVVDSQLDNVAPVVNGAMILKTVPSLPDMEKTPHLSVEFHQNLEPAPDIPEPSINLNTTTLILNQTPLAQDEYFAALHHLDVVNRSFSPSGNPPHIYPPIAVSEDISLSASASTQAIASPSTKATQDKLTAHPVQQKTSKPKVLKEGQRNLKNKGIHRCPVAGCTETSTRDYDLKNRHIRKAHPEEAVRLGLDKPAKARVRPEGAGQLDLNRNMISVDGAEESKPEQDFRCPSCSHPYSRRDALIRHAESIINPERKNKPSCNLTVEEVRSLRKKFKTK